MFVAINSITISMIIDAHTHIELKENTTKDLLASMDNAGIDYALLIASSAPLPDNGPTTEQVIQICDENPRLKAIGCIEYKHISAEQIEKLVSYLKEGEIYGVKLYPGYEDFYPLDEKLFPLYEQCQELKKPVIFHTGLLEDGLP